MWGVMEGAWLFMMNFGIMFHHFHDKERHIKSQGSISGCDLVQMINFLKNDYSIIDANIWYEKAMSNELDDNQICLTFDDALACQYDIAYPILDELGLKAFWFLYSSMYTGVLEKLELYRHFRFSSFDSIESFYDLFFKTAVLLQDSIGIDVERAVEQFDPKIYLQQFSFYSDLDKTFRYIRDYILKEEKYQFIMDKMIVIYGYDIETNKRLLWITEEQIYDLHRNGHIIGLHSHTHPTVMTDKSYREQMGEYRENKRVLENIINSKISSVSYPCNSYNADTDEIMNSLGIRLGFDAVMSNRSVECLHFPRKDHAYIMREMAK
jgi:peptidoglycan/xylan/chitin deacetylase (PgdA/CDA1 family)